MAAIMNQSELERRIHAGEFVALGEYRMSKAEMIKWRDKVTGRQMEAPMLRHTVEFGDKSVAVSERVADGIKIEDISVPFVKGDAVVLLLEEYTAQKGLVSCRGRVIKFDRLTASPSVKPNPGVASGGSRQ